MARPSKPFLLSGRACAALCAVLCCPFAVRADGASSPKAVAGRTGRSAHPAAPKLTKDQKALHALNRLTFGPRPGDVAALNGMGLESWFQQQLHPDQIPDNAFQARLARYPAMQLAQVQLVEHFPTPEMLRRYTRGTLLLPDDPGDRAVYADAALNYEEKREAKSAAKGTQPVMAQGSGSAQQLQSAQKQPAFDDASARAMKNAVLSLPPEARMQRLLSLPPEQMEELMAAVKGPEKDRLEAGLTPAQVEQVAAMRAPERVVTTEVQDVRLLRDVYSERQLQAVMADFWLNHFNVFLHKNQNEPYLLPAYERDVVLPNALGKFEDLLVATAKSPAMLVYLDNWQSLGPNSRAAQRGGSRTAQPGSQAPRGINENYARELMELHTLGVRGGYTQTDVIEVAKCFTGWTIDRPAQGGEFLFNATRHEPGPKMVLGHAIPEAGMDEGLEVLHLLATSPSTAHLLSQELAQRFVSDTPPPALVNRMSATFLKSDGDIRAVLTTMFHSPEFWSPEVYRAKVKTPLEFVTSALRATGGEIANPTPLVQSLDRLGMPLYGMATPNGYSWDARDWVSSNALLTRMNFALVLSGNRLGGTRLNWGSVLRADQLAQTNDQQAAEAVLERTLLGEPASPRTREAALAQAGDPTLQSAAEGSFRAVPVSSRVGSPATQNEALGAVPSQVAQGTAKAGGTPLATMAGLLLGSPDFQKR